MSRPARGATIWAALPRGLAHDISTHALDDLIRVDISTHAPLAGRDLATGAVIPPNKISTHAPLAGRDLRAFMQT